VTDEGYYTAQVCTNGHVATKALELIPSAASMFCEECGAKTMRSCASCSSPIRGMYRGGFGTEYETPNYCGECGNAFPWTAERLATLRELVGASKASASDKDELLRDLDALATDTPRTQLVALRMRRFLARAGDEVVPAARQVVIQVASAAAKASLGL